MGVLQERNGTGTTVVAKHVWGQDMGGGIGGLLSRTEVSTSANYFYHYDGSGNVMQLTDSTQAVAARYDYDSWGTTQTATGTYASQPYRWSTKEQDAVTGLYYYGFRFYSPSLRTWINRDPIREAGGLNLYAFVGNNPINMLDERGLISVYPGSLVDAGIDAGLDPCAPWYQKAWYYGKPILKQIALDVLIFAATDGMKGPRPGGRPIVGPTVRSYNQPRISGYDQHHLDPPLGRSMPSYRTEPTIDVLNDNSPRAISGGLNYHTAKGGFQTSLNDHISELGYTTKQWNSLPDSVRQPHLRRYYSSLGIPYPK